MAQLGPPRPTPSVKPLIPMRTPTAQAPLTAPGPSPSIGKTNQLAMQFPTEPAPITPTGPQVQAPQLGPKPPVK
jgi:hypothetical protein